MANVMARFSCFLVFLLTLHNGCSLFVEKGQQSILQCVFHNSVTNLTWQLMNGDTAVNISTCSVSTNNCMNVFPTLFQGSISSSGNDKLSHLHISLARTNETEFVCLVDNGNKSNVTLDVYAKPQTPNCRQEINETYVDYTCTTANVYPDVVAVLHRREGEFTDDDYNKSFTKCTRGGYGSGSDGDYSIACTWRVPMENMLVNNTVYVEMTVEVSNPSVASMSATVSPDIVTQLSVPQAYIDQTNCPVGEGVRGDAILIGKKASCTCILVSEGVPKGTARWFTKDGVAVEDPSLTLNITYNYLDPHPGYQCRPITPLRAKVSSSWYGPTFTADYRVMEIGQPLNLECSFPNNVSTVTWQAVNSYQNYNISTCNTGDKKCDGPNKEFYRATIARSGDRITSNLNITSLRKNDWKFACLANNRLQSNITQLELYAVPAKPVCTQTVTNTYVMYSCQSNHVYPEVDVVLHKRGVDFTENDYHLNGPTYTDTDDGVKSAYAVFSVDINNTVLQMTVYAEFTLKIFSMSAINSTPLFSDDVVTQLVVPVVVLSDCPAGPGVHGKTIKIDTQATCKCELAPNGLPRAIGIVWKTKEIANVNQDNGPDGSLTLHFSYDRSEKNRTYECVALGILQGNTTKASYTPVFTSSAQTIAISLMQFFIIILGAVSFGTDIRCS